MPYLLHIAMLIMQYLPTFSAAPKATFRLLGKLDLAFASLLQGRQVDTGEPLPSFVSGRGVSGTEKVRLKSIADQTRGVVAKVMNETDVDELDASSDEDDEMGISMSDAIEDVEVSDRDEVGVATVYDRCIVTIDRPHHSLNEHSNTLTSQPEFNLAKLNSTTKHMARCRSTVLCESAPNWATR